MNPDRYPYVLPGGKTVNLTAAITTGAPAEVVGALGDDTYARTVIFGVIEGVFEVRQPHLRPAEFCVQHPCTTVCVEGGYYGLQVCLAGVSWGRETKVYHDALRALEIIVVDTVSDALRSGHYGIEDRVQVFVTLMVDGIVPSLPGTGVYQGTCHSGTMLELEAVWVTSQGRES